MKIVVGLGNPGRKYAGTRHNVGFDVIGELAKRCDVSRPRTRFEGEIAETCIRDEKTVLICPLTYMNRSGRCVRAVVDFFKLDLDDLLIICDDFNLPVGRLRLRPRGSDGGQNGLGDIIRQLGTQQFGRLRIGIGGPPEGWNVANYVTGRFDDSDRAIIDTAVSRAADAAEIWIADGMAQAMNQFNADPSRRASSGSGGPARRSDDQSVETPGNPDVKAREK